MPNVVQIMRDEIRRVARKEIRSESTSLINQVRKLRETVKKQNQTITQLQKSLVKLSPQSTAVVLGDSDDEQPRARITPASIKRQRTKLKLSQRELGKLLGVTATTVVRWETGTCKPRATHQAQIAELRNMSIQAIKTKLAN